MFLYGRPVKWSQLSENTDNAFDYYQELMRQTRFDSAVREAKRAAGAEGCAAILYHVYRDADNTPRLLLNVLSKKTMMTYTRSKTNTDGSKPLRGVTTSQSKATEPFTT